MQFCVAINCRVRSVNVRNVLHRSEVFALRGPTVFNSMPPALCDSILSLSTFGWQLNENIFYDSGEHYPPYPALLWRFCNSGAI